MLPQNLVTKCRSLATAAVLTISATGCTSLGSDTADMTQWTGERTSKTSITVDAGATEALDFSVSSGAFRVSLAGAGPEATARLHVVAHDPSTGFTFERESDVSAAPTMAVPVNANAAEELVFEVSVQNLGNTSIDGEVVLSAGIEVGGCADVAGLWPTDPVQYVARCTVVLEPRVPVDGLLGSTEPNLDVTAIDLCLGRSHWGYDGQGYYSLGGHLEYEGTYTSGSTTLHGGSFAGRDGESHAIETEDAIDIRDYRKGAAIIENKDWVKEVVYDKHEQTLHYVEGNNPWGPFSGWDYTYSTSLSCEPL